MLASKLGVAVERRNVTPFVADRLSAYSRSYAGIASQNVAAHLFRGSRMLESPFEKFPAPLQFLKFPRSKCLAVPGNRQ
jgi:hypothetical protein